MATLAGVGATVASRILSLFGSAAQFVWDRAVANGISEHLKALTSDSNFLFQLERDEEAVGIRDRITMRYVIAESDLFVERNSAVGSGDFHVVPGTDHWSLVKPVSRDDRSLLLLRQFLVDTRDRQPFDALAEHRQPLLQHFRCDKVAGTDARKHFVFKNQAIPFVGREADLAHMDAFLAPHESPFRWMVLAGSGGIGKSRLALEFCQAKAAHHWNAGFANPEREAIDWRTWQPRMPTLIAIDYAGRLASDVGRMLAGLAERTPSHLLRFPVRILVIEREAQGQWLDTVLQSSYRVDDGVTRHRTLKLGQLDDPWPIFEAVNGGTKLGRNATLKALRDIDPEQRPLFAFLMADAIAQGKNVREWDRTVLLRNIIDRDREVYWRGPATSGVRNRDEPITAVEERALVLATMTGGLSSDFFDGTHGNLLPRWNTRRSRPLRRRMISPDSALSRPGSPSP